MIKKKLIFFILIVVLVQSTLFAPNQGLVNQNGNDCFFSSSFQCLSQIKPFIKFFADNPVYTSGPIQSRFYKFIQDMKTQSELTEEFRAFITSNTTTDNYFLHQMKTGQRDAHEFLSLLLQYLIGQTPYHTEIKKQLEIIIATKVPNAVTRSLMIERIISILNTDMQKITYLSDHLSKVIATEPSNAVLLNSLPLTSNIEHWEACDKQIKKLQELYAIFDTHLNSTLICKTCGYSSITPGVERAIQVPIPSDIKAPTLQNCIDAFKVKETLNGSDQWFCKQCGKKVDATKQYSFELLPKILILSLKRFKAGGAFGEKIDTPVSFPLKLPIAVGKNETAKTLHFNLFGIVCHGGGPTGGHYWAFVKDRTGDNAWRQYNDATVTGPYTEKQIIDLGNDEEPYIFFYELDAGDTKTQQDIVTDSKKPAPVTPAPIIENTETIDIKTVEDLKALFKDLMPMKTVLKNCTELIKNIELFQDAAVGIFQYKNDTQYSSKKATFIAALKKKDFLIHQPIAFETKTTIDNMQEKLAVVCRDYIEPLVQLTQSNQKISLGKQDIENSFDIYSFAFDILERYNKLLIKLEKEDFSTHLTVFSGLKAAFLNNVSTLSITETKNKLETILALAHKLLSFKNSIEKLLASLEAKTPEINTSDIKLFLDLVEKPNSPILQLQKSLNNLRQRLNKLSSSLSNKK